MSRLKIIIKNGESVKMYHDSSDVSVLPKSKLVRTFNDDGSLIDEFKLLDKGIYWMMTLIMIRLKLS